MKVPAAVDQYDMSSLQRIISGAAPLSASLTKAVVNRLKGRGADTKIVQVRIFFPARGAVICLTTCSFRVMA